MNKIFPIFTVLFLAFSVSIAAQDLIHFNAGKKWGYVRPGGAAVIAPRYDLAYPFSEGLALVWTKGRYGFTDKAGAPIIPFNYDRVFFFKNGIAKVTVKNKAFYINRSGKEYTMQ